MNVKSHPQIDQLMILLRANEFEPVREFVFHPTRKWRFDVACVEHKIAFEYHGHGGFIGKGVSGHSTIKGLTSDSEKMNQAQLLGWRVFAFTALHFRETERARHKLKSPTEVIEYLSDTRPMPF